MPNLRLVLLISIVLNVFLAGALIGGVVSMEVRKPHPVVNLRVAARQLPEPEGSSFRQAMQATRMNMRDTIRQGRQARREAAALLEQPTLDSASLLAALARVRAADIALRAKLEERIVAFAATSTPEVRQLLAERIARNIRPQ